MKRLVLFLILYCLVFLILAVRASLRVGFFNVLIVSPSDLFSSYFLAYLAMIVLYFYLLYFWRKEGEIPQRWIGLTFIAISFFSIFIPPSSSCDLYYYVSYGVIQGKLGLNPYIHAITELYQTSSPSFDQVVGFPASAPLTYGYIVAFLLKILYHLSFGSEIMIYILIKMISACSLYLIYVYLKRILEHFNIEGRTLAGLLFLLNPVIHIQYLINGHNDALMCLFICAGLYHLFQKRRFLAIVSLTLSVHVKLTALFVIPMVLIYCAKKRTGILRLAGGGLIVIVSFLPYLFIYGLKSAPPGVLEYRSSFDFSVFTCVYYLLELSGGAPIQSVLKIFQVSLYIWIAIYGGGIILYLLGKKDEEFRMFRLLEALYLIYLAFFSNVIYPWYFLWLTPFIFRDREFKTRFVRYTIIFFILELYFGFAYYFIFSHTSWLQPSVLVIYLLSVGIYFLYPDITRKGRKFSL